jgi:hypothetical protein
MGGVNGRDGSSQPKPPQAGARTRFPLGLSSAQGCLSYLYRRSGQVGQHLDEIGFFSPPRWACRKGRTKPHTANLVSLRNVCFPPFALHRRRGRDWHAEIVLAIISAVRCCV